MEVGPGSIVLIHGDLLHWSVPNTSPKPRPAYVLHIAETAKGY